MLFKTLFQKIESSKAFERFKQDYENAELVIGYFVLDFIGIGNQFQLDYKTDNKIFSFSIDINNQISMKQEELIQTETKQELKSISPNINIDLNKLQEIIKNKLREEKITQELQKIIAILQIYNNEQAWNTTCIFEGLIIINIVINSQTGKIIKFEKKNLTDFIRKV